MGTSLKVHGLKRLVKGFAKAVHAKKGLVVFINATPPGKEWEGVIDVHVHGETDKWVERVEEEWRRLRPQDWQTQTLLDGDVVPRIGKGNGKGKAKGQSGSLRTTVMLKDLAEDKENIPPVPFQLPTPRSSQSPRRTPAKARSSFDITSSPLTNLSASPDRDPYSADVGAPPTPLSPNKRRANISPLVPDNGLSPTKKAKPIVPPITGLCGTPGRGNLFRSPAKAPALDDWVDEDFFRKSKALSGNRPCISSPGEKDNQPVRLPRRCKPAPVRPAMRPRRAMAATVQVK